jgi:hypothetical protein
MIETALTPGQVRAVIGQLKREMAAAQRAVPQVREEFRQGIGTQTTSPTGGGSPASPAAGALPEGLPPGSQQVGTKDGNPVYRTPAGELYMAH